MRLGGVVFEKFADPEGWVAALRRLGYSAAYCPLKADDGPDVIGAYAETAHKAGIVIAEVGAWGNNPIDPDEGKRRASIEACRRQLALAEAIGARCCVNVAGSRGPTYSGPHPDNLTADTFDLVVESVRAIIDGVKPTRTFYALETMPWSYPNSVESYLRLIRSIDRKQFAAHLDPVNLISSPERYFNNGALIREGFAKLGPYIRSVHAKDTLMSTRLTTHIGEVGAGKGTLDYRTLLTELNKLDPDTPLMLEHMQTEEEYAEAAAHVRGVADGLGLRFLE